MAKRRSVNYPGYSHQNPIPNASRIGNIVMSSIMNGTEPGTRTIRPISRLRSPTSSSTSSFASKPPAEHPTTSSRSTSG